MDAGQARQAAIREMLTAFAGKAGDKLYKDRKAFLTDLKAVDRERGVRLSVSEIKAVLNRHFYRYEPPPLDKIEADTWKLEGEIMEMLAEVAR